MKNIVVYTVPLGDNFKTIKNWFNNLQKDTAKHLFIVSEEDPTKLGSNVKHNLGTLKQVGEPVSFKINSDQSLVSELYFAEDKRKSDTSGDMEMFSFDINIQNCAKCPEYSSIKQEIKSVEDKQYSAQLEALIKPIYYKLDIEEKEMKIDKEEILDLIDELESFLKTNNPQYDLGVGLEIVRAK